MSCSRIYTCFQGKDRIREVEKRKNQPFPWPDIMEVDDEEEEDVDVDALRIKLAEVVADLTRKDVLLANFQELRETDQLKIREQDTKIKEAEVKIREMADKITEYRREIVGLRHENVDLRSRLLAESNVPIRSKKDWKDLKQVTKSREERVIRKEVERIALERNTDTHKVIGNFLYAQTYSKGE